jgi:dynein heavy chain
MDAREFAWESQLRFYWDRGLDDILIRQCTGEIGEGRAQRGTEGHAINL